MSFLVSDHAFTNNYYYFSVAAITIGAGPTTERISVQTFADGNCVYVSIGCSL